MSAPAIFLSVVLALIVAALAFYLVRVVLLLWEVGDTLGKVTFGVRAIAWRTRAIGPVVAGVNASLGSVAGALEGLAAKTAAEEPVEEQAS